MKKEMKKEKETSIINIFSNGMHTNKKIYSFIGMIVFVISFLITIESVLADTTVWQYETSPVPHTYTFKTQLECGNNRALYIQNTGGEATMCSVTTIAGEPVVENIYKIEPSSNGSGITFSEDYTLLAPIGNLDKIKTTDIGYYFNRIFLIAIGLAGALAVIVIIIGGVQWMGTDSVFGKTEAKKQITSAILGLLIALGSYALLNTVDPALLGTKGLSVDQVNIELEEEEIPWSTYSSSGNLALCPEGFIDIQDGNQGKINVCKSIAEDLTKLIATAKTNGIILSGYGSRNTEQQLSLRRKNNCPDIENSPAEACKPPTARPGRSMHESGMAIDFRCNGKSMMEAGGKNSVCFKWLADSKNNTLLKNLASEPWHWSTTGK
jgi:hypothetical protein